VKLFLKPFEITLLGKIFFFLFVCLLLNACDNRPSTAEAISFKTSIQTDSILKAVGQLMDDGDFESSQKILLNTLEKPYVLENLYDQYFLHTYLAEVMYYTALNEQGLQNAGKALKISRSLHNDTLIGNACNLLGLIHLSGQRYDSAKVYFQTAMQKLPVKLNKKGMSRYDHVLSNLAETYLYLEEPKKSIELSKQAMIISLELDFPRAVILNHWTLGEAYILKNDLDSAMFHFNQGMLNPELNKSPDVRIFLFEGMIKVASKIPDINKLNSIELESAGFVGKNENYDFARIQYYTSIVDAFLIVGNYQKASIYQQKLNALKDNIRQKRETLHMRLLNSYYKNEQEVAISDAIKLQQEQELKLNQRILIILGFLIFVLALLFIFFRRWMVQKRKIERLKFQHEKAEIIKQQELVKLQERFNAIEEERNRIARELHDDIGSSMSSVSIFADLAANEFEKNPPKALELISRIKLKTQEISETISDLIWAIYSRNDSWGSLIDRTKNFCFEILTSKGIQVEISDDYRMRDQQLSIHYKKNLMMFLKEAVNNIAKYSNASKAEIQIELIADKIQLIVKDNGIGFDPKSITRGNGLSSLHARANSLGGHVDIESIVGIGTTIKLNFSREENPVIIN
jgi:signal transduction histidine kinase